jgi:hypothetical protein
MTGTAQPDTTPPAHYVMVGGTLMHCVQLDCDGVHHYYCSCTT